MPPLSRGAQPVGVPQYMGLLWGISTPPPAFRCCHPCRSPVWVANHVPSPPPVLPAGFVPVPGPGGVRAEVGGGLPALPARCGAAAAGQEMGLAARLPRTGTGTGPGSAAGRGGTGGGVGGGHGARVGVGGSERGLGGRRGGGSGPCGWPGGQQPPAFGSPREAAVPRGAPWGPAPAPPGGSALPLRCPAVPRGQGTGGHGNGGGGPNPSRGAEAICIPQKPDSPPR